MRLLVAAGLVAALLVTACGRREEKEAQVPAPAPTATAGPTGFSHDAAFDAAGYYQPITNIVIGNYQLDHIAIGAPSDFAAWEKGQREGLFGPIMLEFNDVTSPREPNELGAEVHTVRIRVMPKAYTLNAADIAFSGEDANLGQVAFEGSFDAPSFAEAAKTGSSGDKPVAIGDLTLGANTIRAQRFTYFAGD